MSLSGQEARGGVDEGNEKKREKKKREKKIETAVWCVCYWPMRRVEILFLGNASQFNQHFTTACSNSFMKQNIWVVNWLCLLGGPPQIKCACHEGSGPKMWCVLSSQNQVINKSIFWPAKDSCWRSRRCSDAVRLTAAATDGMASTAKCHFKRQVEVHTACKIRGPREFIFLINNKRVIGKRNELMFIVREGH